MKATKTNRAGDKKKSAPFDRCQTPFYGLDPILPYLKPDWVIWEPAAGNGNMVRKLSSQGYNVIAGDLLTGQNFFNYNPAGWNCLVTNPPYSIKYMWLKRCYELGKPFALLLPVETLGAMQGQRLIERYGAELVLLDKRVDFCMPNKGYSGKGSDFPTYWHCWGLTGQPITCARVTKYPDEQIAMTLPGLAGVLKDSHNQVTLW